MKKTFKGFLLGFLSAAVLLNGLAYAVGTTTLYDVITDDVKIVVDNQILNPTDANGNKVEPIIYNGTTYLPVRAVANAFGKAVYWDGPDFTVYLGDMDGKLKYPTDELSTDDNIGHYSWESTNDLKDNLGNMHSRGISSWSDGPYEKICNMKYSKFKGVIYVKNGSSFSDGAQIIIKADGKTIYTSPEITKISKPISFDLDITGCYDLQITNVTGNSYVVVGDAGFYQ